jgi:hypothetical protein
MRTTHRVVSKGSYEWDSRQYFAGTPDECAKWIADQEHPEYYEVGFTLNEQNRRNILRKLTGEAEPQFITEREEAMVDLFLVIEDEYKKRLDRSAESVANHLFDFLNKGGRDYNDLLDEFERYHRTIQQDLTKLMFNWLERVASDKYRHDGIDSEGREGRNYASHMMCKRLLDNWALPHPDDKPHMDAATMKQNPPSRWLSFI